MSSTLAAQLRLHLPVEIPPNLEVLEICRELPRVEPEDAHAPIAELFCRMLMRYTDARPRCESSAGARHRSSGPAPQHGDRHGVYQLIA